VKLLIYSHYFAPSVGGVETIVALLARKLSETQLAQPRGDKWDVIVATKTPANGFDDHAFPFRVVRAPSSRELWRLIRWADVTHVAGPSVLPMFLAKLAGKPYVVEHHGYQAISPNGVLIHQPDRAICPGHFQAGRYGACIRCQQQEMSLPRALSKLLLMFPRHLLSCTADLNIAITHHSLERHRLPRTQVIYYGIEPLRTGAAPLRPMSASSQPQEFPAKQNEIRSSEDPREPDSTNNNPPAFAYVGRFVPEKGLDVLLQAAKLLKNDGCQFQVFLVGDGPERKKLEALIAANNLQDVARITGFLRGSALSDQMSRVDAVVMPSTWEETAGLSAIEQMMRGRLVIASDIGGLGEIVAEAGLKFLPGAAAGLAAQMKKVIQHSPEVSTLAKAAQARAHSLFLADRMTADHASAYQKLL
jgi:glycosyltransferase involved in cell wall biosynthesis